MSDRLEDLKNLPADHLSNQHQAMAFSLFTSNQEPAFSQSTP